MIPLSKPIINEEMVKAAMEALTTDKLVLGENVYKFEEEFAKYNGVDYAIAVNSGTAALHISLLAAGIKKGQKALTTPNSFVATSNSILHAGAVPVFVDIEENTGNINTTLIKSTIKRYNTKAILPVHLYGNPCDMDDIIEVARKNDLIVIEDACQAHGALYKGKKVGSIGDVGCFSFYSIKNMTVGGDGGMLTTNDEKIAERAGCLRDCGRRSKYEHVMVGFTARLNTINAAIGRVQLKYLDKWNENRRKIAKEYRKRLPEKIQLLDKESVKAVYHQFVIKTESRNKLKEYLKINDVETGIHYPIPIHLQPIYKELFGLKEGSFPIAEDFSKKVLSLPMYPELDMDKVKFICEKISEVIG